MVNQVNWKSAAQSNPGRRRKINEDAYLDHGKVGLWCVADGMGGYKAGDLASQAVINAVRHYRGMDNLADIAEYLEQRVIEVNEYLVGQSNAREDQSPIGSTVALLVAVGEHALVIWAGDSRIYRLRGDEIEQLTEDHSLVQEMVNMGRLKAEEAEDHPSANVISRAVGVTEELFLDMDYIHLRTGDRLLLCSDGLYKELNVDSIKDVMRQKDIDKANNTLIEKALAAGGRDNITTILVDILN